MGVTILSCQIICLFLTLKKGQNKLNKDYKNTKKERKIQNV